MTHPSHIARCPGFGDGPEDWLHECDDCQRRTAPPGGHVIEPPAIVTLWCESYIPPDRPEDQRLRELARTAGTYYPPSLGTGQFLCNPPFMDTPNRDDQHGGMEPVGAVSQYLKTAMRDGRNWERLTCGHQEALDMIAHKIARILSGADPHDLQHWEDVAGYAQAAMRGRQP